MARKQAKSTSNPFVRSLRRAVLRQMKDEGISQAELAERMKCTPANVSNILHGDSDLKGGTISNLLVAVGLELALADPQEALTEDAGNCPGRVLVARPKRTANTKQGQRYDYSSHLGYMARLIVQAKQRGENLSERTAARAAVEWAKGQENLAQVTAGTLRTHFAADRDQLLAEARRALGEPPQPREGQLPSEPRPGRPRKSAMSRPSGSRPTLGTGRLGDGTGMTAAALQASDPLGELDAADPSLTAPEQELARVVMADRSMSKLTDPVGEMTRELERSTLSARPVRIPSLADFPSSAHLPELGFPKNDPHLDPHGYMKKTFEELTGPKIPSLAKPWST